MGSWIRRYAQVLTHRPRKAEGVNFEARLLGKFDAQWYRNRYLNSDPSGDAIGHYLAEGIKLGNSPNAWFDESFYVSFYSDVVVHHAYRVCRETCPFWHDRDRCQAGTVRDVFAGR